VVFYVALHDTFFEIAKEAQDLSQDKDGQTSRDQQGGKRRRDEER